jgi:hypothetical protein
VVLRGICWQNPSAETVTRWRENLDAGPVIREAGALQKRSAELKEESAALVKDARELLKRLAEKRQLPSNSSEQRSD